jgi:hypothetical protein
MVLVFVSQVRSQEADKTTTGDKNGKEHVTKAKIVRIDPAKQTITVNMKDKEGKQVQRTFQLKGSLKAFNEKGEASRVDVFQEGNTLYVVERNERVFELRATPEHKNKEGTNK